MTENGESINERGTRVGPDLIKRANDGDAAALEEVLVASSDQVFRLALRMVTQRSEAEDATQEILIKVLTRLSSYRHEASFSTWVHRVAVNHLLDRKKSAVEKMRLNFDRYAEDLATGLAAAEPGPESAILTDEVRLACTQAMLTCLDREHRVAYIVGEIFNVSSNDGSYICSVTPATYRKRLSRARSKIRSFVQANCGLINNDAACRCGRRVEQAVSLGRINPNELELVTLPVEEGVKEMEKLYDVASLFRNHPHYQAPGHVKKSIVDLLASDEFELLSRSEQGTNVEPG